MHMKYSEIQKSVQNTPEPSLVFLADLVEPRPAIVSAVVTAQIMQTSRGERKTLAQAAKSEMKEELKVVATAPPKQKQREQSELEKRATRLEKHARRLEKRASVLLRSSSANAEKVIHFTHPSIGKRQEPEKYAWEAELRRWRCEGHKPARVRVQVQVKLRPKKLIATQLITPARSVL